MQEEHDLKVARRLTVVGLGYIGLPTAAVFAELGFSVLGVDVKPDVVNAINEGRPHIAEPDLDELVAEVVQSGRLRASQNVDEADAFIIAVPTPFKAGNEPDLSYVRAAAEMIAPVLKPEDLVILESTSPVGATEQVADWLAELRPDLKFPKAGEPGEIAVAYCPERVLPGQILHEMRTNDRLLGGVSKRCASRAATLYGEVASGHCHETTARTAELAKLAENAFRDVNIAFANELSLIASDNEVDVWELIDLANLHPRVDILRPGPGVGGHCIAVDPWFIVHGSPERSRLIRQARLTNDAKPDWVVQRVLALLESHESPTLTCLGLAYKPNVGDLRESPAVEIVRRLASESDARVVVVEPHVDALPVELEGLVTLERSIPQEPSQVALLLVRHSEFDDVDPSTIGHVLFDTVGAWRDKE